jgi:hypothetical protein
MNEKNRQPRCLYTGSDYGSWLVGGSEPGLTSAASAKVQASGADWTLSLGVVGKRFWISIGRVARGEICQHGSVICESLEAVGAA